MTLSRRAKVLRIYDRSNRDLEHRIFYSHRIRNAASFGPQLLNEVVDSASMVIPLSSTLSNLVTNLGRH